MIATFTFAMTICHSKPAFAGEESQNPKVYEMFRLHLNMTIGVAVSTALYYVRLKSHLRIPMQAS
ncbi:MAG: hypothetical protein K2N12_08055, partial [Helicobacter sp.]|nr:hypothetical protein [Helicobacter sp.]